MTRLLIAGAGYVGQALAAQAVALGSYEVSVLRRSAVDFPGARALQADLLNPQSLKALPEFDEVVYCAAADGSDAASYESIYHDGLRNLVTALSTRGGYRRLVYVSSTSVYAEAAGNWVDETDTNLVRSGTSTSMVAGERVLMDGALDYSIVRLGGIYGPGRTWFLRRVKEGAERIYTRGGVFSNRIHRDDCAGVILHALRGKAERQIYNGVDSESVDRNEVIRWVAQKLGLPADHVPASDDIADIPARGNKRISNQKIRDAGYRFLYPSYREGYAPLLAEV